MLQIRSLRAAYGESTVLHGVDLAIYQGEIVALLGRNGVGKTTTLETIMGLVHVTGGQITFDGEALTSLKAHHIPRRGIAYVPQGRRIFSEFTVMENLAVAILRGRPDSTMLAWVFDLFPVLHERRRQQGGSLSGGEQQMLAIGRALMAHPRLILMDEPTEGLSPAMAETVRRAILDVHRSGIAILLVEQDVQRALSLATRVNIMEKGQIRMTASPSELNAQPQVIEELLSVRKPQSWRQTWKPEPRSSWP